MDGVEKVILDFDGTLTDPWSVADDYYALHAQAFSEETGIPISEFRDAVKGFMRAVTENPVAGWEFGGYVVAPAHADPYLLTTAAYKLLLRSENEFERFVENEDEIFNTTFHAASKALDVPARDGVYEFIDAIATRFDPVIVTNSMTETVVEKIVKMGLGGLPVIGNAKKYRIHPKWNEVPERIQPSGFPRPVLLRRRDYADRLAELAEQGYTPQNAVVVGDIFELDHALPLILGYRSMLIDTLATRQCERDYLASLPNGLVVKDLRQARAILDQ